MQNSLRCLSISTGQYLRIAFLRLLTGLVVGLPPEEVRARIIRLHRVEQAGLVSAGLLGVLLATSLFAQAGIGGPLALWITLWLLAR